MAFCTKCGKEIKEGLRFCSSCGNPLFGSVTFGSAANDVRAGNHEKLDNSSLSLVEIAEKYRAVTPPQQTAPSVQSQQYKQTMATKMTPWDGFSSAIKKYGIFYGRARRAEFWWFALFSSLISLPAIIRGILGIVTGVGLITGDGTLYDLVSLFFFLPSLAVWIRRIHDVGKSGWCLLIPIYNIALLFIAGDAGPNKYGPDPKVV